METINDLTWDYFWEQKIQEIQFIFLLLFIIAIICIALPLAIGNSIGDGMDDGCGSEDYVEGFEQKCDILDTLGEGIFYMVIFTVPIFLVYAWINSNWNKAKNKAEWKLEEIKELERARRKRVSKGRITLKRKKKISRRKRRK